MGLQQCLAREEVKNMVSGYVKQMEIYLLSLAWPDGGTSHIENCPEFYENRYRVD